MIQITPQMRIVVAVEAVDFRKGIDGLAGICRNVPESPVCSINKVFKLVWVQVDLAHKDYYKQKWTRIRIIYSTQNEDLNHRRLERVCLPESHQDCRRV
jgi:hypothetical protein